MPSNLQSVHKMNPRDFLQDDTSHVAVNHVAIKIIEGINLARKEWKMSGVSFSEMAGYEMLFLLSLYINDRALRIAINNQSS